MFALQSQAPNPPPITLPQPHPPQRIPEPFPSVSMVVRLLCHPFLPPGSAPPLVCLPSLSTTLRASDSPLKSLSASSSHHAPFPLPFLNNPCDTRSCGRTTPTVLTNPPASISRITWVREPMVWVLQPPGLTRLRRGAGSALQAAACCYQRLARAVQTA